MPAMNGIDAILSIRRDHPAAKIVVLTTYSGDVQALRAFKAGAAGYLLKSMLRRDLIETIRTVNSGRRRIPPEIAQAMADHVDGDRLSDREIEVLRSVAAGCSNKAVASSCGPTLPLEFRKQQATPWYCATVCDRRVRYRRLLRSTTVVARQLETRSCNMGGASGRRLSLNGHGLSRT